MKRFGRAWLRGLAPVLVCRLDVRGRVAIRTPSQAKRIISLRPSHRTRSRAFGQLALASVLIAQQEPDQAVGIAADVLNATQSLGSYLVISQLIQLQRQLEPYSGNAVVAEFLNCLQDAVCDRLAFYQLTAEGRHPHEAWEGP